MISVLKTVLVWTIVSSGAFQLFRKTFNVKDSTCEHVRQLTLLLSNLFTEQYARLHNALKQQARGHKLVLKGHPGNTSVLLIDFSVAQNCSEPQNMKCL